MSLTTTIRRRFYMDNTEKKKRTGRNKSNDNHPLKRTLCLDVRLSPREMEQLDDKYDKSEFNSRAAFVRSRIFGNSANAIELKLEEEFTYKLLSARQELELRRQGNNINQLAKFLNSNKFLTPADKKKMHEIFESLSNNYKNLLDEFLKSNDKK